DEGGSVSKLSRRSLALLAGLAAVAAPTLFATTATGSPTKKQANVDVCVLLPDTKSSVRYELFDPPYLSAAFKAAGVAFSITNAQGDQNAQRSQGDQCLTNGAKVVVVDALNSGVGAAIEEAAASKGAKSIDYDRLVLNGKAAYYVSFNNVSVGVLQGKGVV